ncbi:MAG: hypothetical protein AB8B85_12450 [Paracoccaceae bacterium]
MNTSTSTHQVFAARLADWLVWLGENAAEARAARAFSKLDALSDDELKRLGLARNELNQRFAAKLHRG